MGKSSERLSCNVPAKSAKSGKTPSGANCTTVFQNCLFYGVALLFGDLLVDLLDRSGMHFGVHPLPAQRGPSRPQLRAVDRGCYDTFGLCAALHFLRDLAPRQRVRNRGSGVRRDHANEYLGRLSLGPARKLLRLPLHCIRLLL